jgi:hypothetical protein
MSLSDSQAVKKRKVEEGAKSELALRYEGEFFLEVPLSTDAPTIIGLAFFSPTF